MGDQRSHKGCDMKIALLADVHGNDLALQAVLADIEKRGGVEAFWVLGDLAALGHAPVKSLEILAALPGLKVIRGNTDHYVAMGDRPGPTLEEVLADQAKLDLLVELEGNFSWTQGAITATGWQDWLSDLPLEFRTQLPDGTTVLGVHASPSRVSGSGLLPEMAEAEIEALLLDCPEDLICVGHTHQPFSFYFRDQHIVNPGSVSNPGGPDPRASYGILTASEDGYQFELFRVAYDHHQAIATLNKIRLPGRKFIIQKLGG